MRLMRPENGQMVERTERDVYCDRCGCLMGLCDPQPETVVPCLCSDCQRMIPVIRELHEIRNAIQRLQGVSPSTVAYGLKQWEDYRRSLGFWARLSRAAKKLRRRRRR